MWALRREPLTSLLNPFFILSIIGLILSLFFSFCCPAWRTAAAWVCCLALAFWNFCGLAACGYRLQPACSQLRKK